MNNFKFILIALFLINVNSILSQEKKSKFNLEIAQASDNAYTKSKPASAILTLPRDTLNDSYAVNGYIGISQHFPDKVKSEWMAGIFIEWHKNTLINKKQDMLQFGFQGGKQYFIENESKYKLNTLLSFKYSRDKEKDKKGMQVLMYGNLLPKSSGGHWTRGFLVNEYPFPENEREFNNDDKNFYPSDLIQFKSSHAFGFEYIGYEKILMYNLSYNLEIYPFSGFLYQLFGYYQLIKIDLGIEHRGELTSQKTDLFIGNFIKSSIGLNFYLDKEKKQALGIAYSYQEGGNPLKGLEDTIFNQLAITAKINLN